MSTYIRKSIIGFILLSTYTSCVSQISKLKDVVHHEFIEALVYGDSASQYIDLSIVLVFYKSTDDKLGYLSVDELKKLYNTEYRSIDFDIFIKKILHQEITFDCSNFHGCFNLDKTVKLSYENEPFDTFLTKYNQKISDGTYTIKSSLDHDEKMTIFYYLFQKGYYTTFDDYIGRYYSRKIENFNIIERIDPDSLIFEED